jgi:hypothetical protein
MTLQQFVEAVALQVPKSNRKVGKFLCEIRQWGHSTAPILTVDLYATEQDKNYAQELSTSQDGATVAEVIVKAFVSFNAPKLNEDVEI